MTMKAGNASLVPRRGVCTSAAGLCRRIAWVVAVVPAIVLALGAGQVAWADHNPSTCSATGPALLIFEFFDTNNDGIGDSPVDRPKVPGDVVYYQAQLFHLASTGQCAYEGGTLCIDPPGAQGCTDVTPVGGIPLLCN